MLIGKLLVIAGILTAGMGTSTAQSRVGVASVPVPGFAPIPHDSRVDTPKIGGIGKSTVPANSTVLMPGSKPGHITVLRPNRESVCYTMRSYNLETEDPVYGITKLNSATTCELAANVHLKDASGPLLK